MVEVLWKPKTSWRGCAVPCCRAGALLALVYSGGELHEVGCLARQVKRLPLTSGPLVYSTQFHIQSVLDAYVVQDHVSRTECSTVHYWSRM